MTATVPSANHVSSATPSPRVARVFVLIMLALHALLLLDAAATDFVTIDEASHLAAAAAYCKLGTEHPLYIVNPPGGRLAGGLIATLCYPDLKVAQSFADPSHRPEFGLGNSFALYNKDHYQGILFVGRLQGIAWSLLGGWLASRWAGQVGGVWCRLLACCLWCFEPTILAHGHLLTPDVPAAVMSLAAGYAFWRYMQQPGCLKSLGVGLVLGVALLTKFTHLGLLVILPGATLTCLMLFGRRFTPARTLVQRTWHALLMFGVALVTVCAAYGFHGVFRPLGTIPFVSNSFNGPLGQTPGSSARPINRFTDSLLGRVPVPVPELYLRGLDIQRRDLEEGARSSYLRGEFRFAGWWYWYLYGFAVKLPLGMLALILIGIAETVRAAISQSSASAVLWLAFAAGYLVLVSAHSNFTNHFRYVLPAVPYLIMMASMSGAFALRSGLRGVVAVSMLLAASIVSTACRHPCYLSYFNELAGGPSHGYRHLVDSNFDWGQDLLRLKDWVRKHSEVEDLKLAYFGGVDPRIVDLQCERPPARSSFGSIASNGKIVGPEPGWFALSATYLMGASELPPRPVEARAAHDRNDYTYFQDIAPVARAGYSILIYQVSEAEANRMRSQLGLPGLQ